MQTLSGSSIGEMKLAKSNLLGVSVDTKHLNVSVHSKMSAAPINSRHYPKIEAKMDY